MTEVPLSPQTVEALAQTQEVTLPPASKTTSNTLCSSTLQSANEQFLTILRQTDLRQRKKMNKQKTPTKNPFFFVLTKVLRRKSRFEALDDLVKCSLHHVLLQRHGVLHKRIGALCNGNQLELSVKLSQLVQSQQAQQIDSNDFVLYFGFLKRKEMSNEFEALRRKEKRKGKQNISNLILDPKMKIIENKQLWSYLKRSSSRFHDANTRFKL